jgi:TRAP-type C4-dicarboxylate transport system permease small subunit
MSGSAHSVTTAPHGGNPVLKLIGWISQVCGWLAAFMVLAAVGITCQMIFVRFILNESTIWQTEAVTYLMIAATMIGLPYVQYLRGHVNVDLFPMMLPMGARKLLAVITSALALLIVGAMLWHGYHFWFEAWDWGETSNTPWNPRLWIPYLVLPVGFGLYLLQLIADLWATLSGVEKPFGIATEETGIAALAAESKEAE